MLGDLIAYKDFDHGPGPPYERWIKRHLLLRIHTPNDSYYPPRRFYITIDGTSKTWLSDEQAEETMKRWEQIPDCALISQHK